MPSETKSPKKRAEKPSDLELAKAFALFDTDNSGQLSLDELKAILCRPTKKSLTDRQVARVLKKCDMDDDGQLSMEEMRDNWAQLGLGGQVQTHKDVAKSAPPSFATLIAEGIPSAASMCYDSIQHQLVIPLNSNYALAFIKL